MALTPTPNPPSSSSSHPQPPLPVIKQLHARLQQLPTRLESQQNLHKSAYNSSSSSSLAPKRKTCPGLFISGDASTTPHQAQDTTSHRRKIARLDLNFTPSDNEMDVDDQDIIPPRIRLTKLKQLARAKKVQVTTSPGRKIARLDLNFAPTEMDVDGQVNISRRIRLTNAPTEMDVHGQVSIPRRIRLTKLKQLARAKKVKLENPDQVEDWKNKLKDDHAGSEEKLESTTARCALSVQFLIYNVLKKEQMSKRK